METAFFVLAKLAGLGLRVETWLAGGLVLSVAAGLWGRHSLARRSGSLTLILLVTVTLFPIGERLLYPLEAAFPPRAIAGPIDGIVVLGGGESMRQTAYWNHAQLNEAGERLIGAAALAMRHPRARLIVSGGSGRLRDTIAGHDALPDVAPQVFASLGIRADRIVWENRSRNTAENARFSFDIADPAPDETWVLVTSAFHMARATSSFEAAGWPAIVPYPVDYRTGNFTGGIRWHLPGNLDALNIAIREWVGRLAYGLTGR